MTLPTDPAKIPEYCRNVSEGKKIQCSDLVTRQKHSERAKLQWKNHKIREKMLSGMLGKHRSAEFCARMSIKTTENMKNPLVRERLRNFAILQWADPENRRKNGERIQKAHIDSLWYGDVKYNDGPQYCEKFNREFKERVRAYWGYRCFECHVIRKKGLSVHHVHYDKKMCCNGSPRDVVPLCASCHQKTNFNRDYWEDHFTELLYLYDSSGKCFFTKEEMSNFVVMSEGRMA